MAAIDYTLTTYPLDLVARYNRPGPRYTSYPTAPQFHKAFGPEAFLEELGAAGAVPGDLSLYVHLPFCRSLCHYCGCHMRVTHRPEPIAQYLAYLEREIDLVSTYVAEQPVGQVHWGGGTPTYLAPQQIEQLMAHLRRRFAIAPDAEISIEADPRELTEAHLVATRRAGFNRISFGVQDFDPDVQQAINRIQPVDQVETVTATARRLGFEGISYDLIYGLPHQTVERFARTVEQVLVLAPDRLSLFSYAHVPWMKKHQQLIDEAALPAPEDKLRILLAATDRLTRGGYRYLGMDHFARPGDSLCRAQEAGTMQRNFQGYSTRAGSTLLGLGVSAISQFDGAYAQNVLGLPAYYAALDAVRPATYRGYRLTDDDRLRRHVIMQLMCHLHLDVPAVEAHYGIDFASYFAEALEDLEPLHADGLVKRTPDVLRVTERGRFFLRNIAMPFDAYLKQAAKARYSQTV